MAANQRSGAAVHHNSWDFLNWPVVLCSVSIWPWLGHLWEYMPTLTGVYMALSASFMLFQMCDKLGLLERFKRRHRPKREH